jgi:hypothetical protein
MAVVSMMGMNRRIRPVLCNCGVDHRSYLRCPAAGLWINQSELRQRYLGGYLIEKNFYRYAHSQVSIQAPNHVTQHADTFLQFNEDYVVGHILFKTLGRTMANGKGVYGAPTACFHPINIKGKT